jgi:enoyl-CoA hydratase/3-hydroxyacyl-CoA dehydrogenase
VRNLGNIKKIGIIGSGTMGHGIAEVSALNSYDVVLIDISQEILDNAINKISSSLSKLIEKEKVDEVLKKLKPQQIIKI